MARYLLTIAPRHEPVGTGTCRLLLLEGALGEVQIVRLAHELLADPVVEQVAWQPLEHLAPLPTSAAQVLEVAYRPGVTDSEADSVLLGAARIGVAGLHTVRTLRRWYLHNDMPTNERFNPLIQLALHYAPHDTATRASFYQGLLAHPEDVPPVVTAVPLRDLDDDGLLDVSRKGILALDVHEMRAIQAYFRLAGRDPRDGELETLAQTWSEHCSHKTFKAQVSYQVKGQGLGVGGQAPKAGEAEVYRALTLLASDCELDSLIKTFLMTATEEVLAARRAAGDDEWVLSAFVDNAGIVAFGSDHELSFKVETHNHPSALEPFGGANTGVGGVVRDVLGVSAHPIANTDVLCFGPLDLPAAQLPDGVLHPARTYAGVVAGVRDYGNKLGIPTVNGAVLFDPGYIANPLVFCGTVGLAPRGCHPRQVVAGDAVVVVGGRTGRDGIHGATFSSIELTHTTGSEVGSAVQIGDPITEKKLIDVLLQARDRRLYHAITDCGAGGLSSAVGEMGAKLGATVDLMAVPRKYAGLLPWEVWLSEAQERMVLAVPPEHLNELLALCASEDVEATAIGSFEPTGRLRVQHGATVVVDLDMAFLHDGRPQRLLQAVWQEARHGVVASGSDGSAGNEAHTLDPYDVLLRLLAHPNIASKERIIRSYDHEVGGATVVKPLVGAHCDGPGNAAVLRPLPPHWQGFALGCGINPRYGQIDPYWMALACVDEALRNVVAVGGDPEQAAILDNFCWGDPREPDRMAALVRAVGGCYDAARAYGTPFISGKDSLNNEYRGADGVRRPIPPTLLISALAVVPDVRRAVTMDPKQPGSYVYLLGATRNEQAGSHYALLCGVASAHVPRVDLAVAPRLLRELHAAMRAGLVLACHDLSEGGLGVAAAEMALAGNVGLRLDLAGLAEGHELSDTTLLWSESPSRFLVEVAPATTGAFEACFGATPYARIGQVTSEQLLVIQGVGGNEVVRAPLNELRRAWQATLADTPIDLRG